MSSSDSLRREGLVGRPVPEDTRRHFRLIVLDGLLWTLSISFIEYQTVLPALATQLTGSTLMVGVIACAMPIGWQWPQLLVARWVETQPLKLPVYKLGAGLNVACNAVAVTLLFAGRQIPPKLLFWLVVFFLWGAMSGIGLLAVPWMDITTKVTPVRLLTRLFSYRRLTGGACGILAGFLVKYVLSTSSPLEFPHNYAVLFLLCGITAAAAFLVFIRVREPVGPVRGRRQSLSEHLRLGPQLLRADPNYRWYLVARCCLLFAVMCLPMLLPFAQQRLLSDPALVGVFVSATMLAATLSNFAWARIGDRDGPLGVLRATARLTLAPPVVALLVGFLPAAPGAPWYAAPRVLFFLLAFMASGALAHGLMIGATSYILEIAPELLRPTYVGFQSTVLIPLSALPILAGALVGWFSFEAVFFGCLIFAALACWTLTRLGPPLPPQALAERGIDLGKGELEHEPGSSEE